MLRSERGQAILMFVGVFTIILFIAAIVVDFGLWWAQRRSDQRAVDLAAAAGVQDLPDNVASAFASACAVADANNIDGDVWVEVFDRSASATPTPSPCGGSLSQNCAPSCNTLRVVVSGDGPLLFGNVFGIANPEVGAQASAGLTSNGGGAAGAGPDQVVLLIDADGWMGNLCLHFAASCAIANARSEANAVVDALAVGAGAEVGYAPYTHCYTPDLSNATASTCVDRPTSVAGLGSDVTALKNAISNTRDLTGGHANLCMPLLEAQRMFQNAPSGGRRTVILLADGDNRYNHSTAWNNIPYPPSPCRPSPYDETFNNAYGECEPDPVPEEIRLDGLTRDMANTLKAEGVEIYVVGVWRKTWVGPAAPNPCGVDDGHTQNDTGYCDKIGDVVNDRWTSDTTSNQRLLKCIASSSDHYVSVDLDEIPGSFQQIASEIVSRSLLQ